MRRLPSKVGKSWLASDMALAVATGRPWLDRFATERGDVLIIDNELHPTTSAQRIPLVMNARGIEPASVSDHLFVSNLRGNLKDIRSLGEYFDHVYEDRFKMIVIDAFYRMLPSDADENDNAAMAGVYNIIDRYAEMLGSAFVLVHHTSKGNQSYKSITDVGAGAGSQARATDSHLVLRPHEEDGAIVLDAAVRSWPPTEPIGLRWNFPVWTPDDALDPDKLRNDGRRRRTKQKPEAAPETVWDAQRFAEAYLEPEPKTVDEILADTKAGDLSGRQAQRLLSQAETAGIAHRWKFASNEKHKFATK
ncbi:MAG: AAA family ATPase, partial [Rubripirellula sp.]